MSQLGDLFKSFQYNYWFPIFIAKMHFFINLYFLYYSLFRFIYCKIEIDQFYKITLERGNTFDNFDDVRQFLILSLYSSLVLS